MRGPTGVLVAHGLAVRKEVPDDGPLLGHVDLHHVRGGGQKGAGHDGVGGHGHADHAAKLRGHDGAARRQGVARGAGCRGDHEAVSAQAVDVDARDRDVKLHDVPVAPAREREVVEREAPHGVGGTVRAYELALNVQRGAVAHVELPRQGLPHRGDEVGRSRAGEKPEVAVGDAKDGRAGVADDAGRPQQRAVASERDHQVAVGRVHDAAGEELLVVRPLGLDALPVKPGLQAASALDGVRARVVGNDEDLHGNPLVRTSVRQW